MRKVIYPGYEEKFTSGEMSDFKKALNGEKTSVDIIRVVNGRERRVKFNLLNYIKTVESDDEDTAEEEFAGIVKFNNAPADEDQKNDVPSL